MARAPNRSPSKVLQITLSEQSNAMLVELARRGIWGRNAAEVAARFIDEALQKFVDAPKLPLRLSKKERTR